jgi:uncharacterized paraquat-inducible protein A
VTEPGEAGREREGEPESAAEPTTDVVAAAETASVAVAIAEPEPVVPDRCPRCDAELAPEQDWCLSCGTAARTVIAAPPRWRAPLAVIAVIAVLCGAALAWAFVALTNNDADVRAAKTTVVAPAPAPAADAAGG